MFIFTRRREGWTKVWTDRRTEGGRGWEWQKAERWRVLREDCVWKGEQVKAIFNGLGRSSFKHAVKKKLKLKDT